MADVSILLRGVDGYIVLIHPMYFGVLLVIFLDSRNNYVAVFDGLYRSHFFNRCMDCLDWYEATMANIQLGLRLDFIADLYNQSLLYIRFL